jgi:steroid delta-isomerase-like uncharacterized protein
MGIERVNGGCRSADSARFGKAIGPDKADVVRTPARSPALQAYTRRETWFSPAAIGGGAIVEPLAVAHRYFDAWNRRDPDEIAGLFAEGGTYCDPASGGTLSGAAIAGYAGGLFGAFPDLAFEIVSAAPAGEGRVAAQWVMRGTNTGSLAGNPPTGGKVELPGADFIQVEGDRVRSVQGYFDQRAFAEQLGLQVIVQPRSVGPVSFGTSTYLQTGKRTKPGAFSLTALEVRSAEEGELVGQLTQRMIPELLQLPGFISFVGVVVGNRYLTISAWEDPESPRQLLKGGAHKEAMEQFFGPQIGAGGITSVWTPHRMNRMWVRCPACGRMADAERAEGKCPCGAALPEHPAYW